MDHAQAQTRLAPPTDWLLEEGAPWVRYWTLRDLLGRPADDPDVIAAHEETVAHPLVGGLLADLADWPGPPLTRHNDAAHLLHKLAALAEFGLTQGDAGLEPIIERVLAHQAAEGAFTVNVLIHERYGGDGQPNPAWALCDAPTVLYALLAFELGDHPQVRRALDHLSSLIRENGWPCAVAGALGDFRGPGRKDDPCPYATLVALKALSRAPWLHESAVTATGVETLLWHWENQKARKLYLFGIGTDFRKPKYPLIWYDVLHVTDVLSRLPGARKDERFRAMLAELMAQADAQGRFTARSMYQAWKGWDFADKKAPSPTVTLTAWRIHKRADETE